MITEMHLFVTRHLLLSYTLTCMRILYNVNISNNISNVALQKLVVKNKQIARCCSANHSWLYVWMSWLSVQCNVQHWTEYKTTLASVRPSVHPSVRCPSRRQLLSSAHNVDRNWLSSVLDRSSPNLEYSFHLTSQRKYFVSSPWNGRGQGHVTP